MSFNQNKAIIKKINVKLCYFFKDEYTIQWSKENEQKETNSWQNTTQNH